MKNQTSGALYAPQSTGVSVPESVKALNEQVNNLQRRYYRSLAPDCEVKTVPDKWYIRVIGWTCAGFLFPPLLAVAARTYIMFIMMENTKWRALQLMRCVNL